MTPEELKTRHAKFVELVTKMRISQRKYFKYRSTQDLEAAKRYEKAVDSFITEEDDRKKSPQTEIF